MIIVSCMLFPVIDFCRALRLSVTGPIVFSTLARTDSLFCVSHIMYVLCVCIHSALPYLESQ